MVGNNNWQMVKVQSREHANESIQLYPVYPRTNQYISALLVSEQKPLEFDKIDKSFRSYVLNIYTCICITSRQTIHLFSFPFTCICIYIYINGVTYSYITLAWCTNHILQCTVSYSMQFSPFIIKQKCVYYVISILSTTVSQTFNRFSLLVSVCDPLHSFVTLTHTYIHLMKISLVFNPSQFLLFLFFFFFISSLLLILYNRATKYLQ